MLEFTTLDRCAAYVAARAAVIAVQRAAGSWPDPLAARARHAAIGTMQLTAAAIAYDHASASRRRYLRDALTSAVSVVTTLDVARASDVASDDLVAAQRVAGRTVALLGMLLHANTSPIPGRR